MNLKIKSYQKKLFENLSLIARENIQDKGECADYIGCNGSI